MRRVFLSLLLTFAAALPLVASAIEVDLAGLSSASGISVKRTDERLHITWPAGEAKTAELILSLRPGVPTVEALSLGGQTLLRDMQPTVFLSVGTRVAPPGQPPGMSIWNVFFDNVPKRPIKVHTSALALKRVTVKSQGRRATVTLGELTAGEFKGELCLTFYAGSPLVHLEAVVSTAEDRRAIQYDAGLLGAKPDWQSVAWLDTGGKLQRNTEPGAAAKPLAVRHRAIAAETERGTVVSFPPPHQFFSPRDFSDNLQNVWFGRGYQGAGEASGFGVRQSPTGGGNFIPWFNAPPGTQQRLGWFLLLAEGRAEDALRAAAAYTHDDRFPTLPGHLTFTTHYHLAHSVSVMKARGEGKEPPVVPEFVLQFKRMGVNAVHLGEFHGDGHQKDPGPLRLPEMETMFAECRRLSGENFLLIPGEEVSGILGITEPNKHPGHWMLLFPKPVYWTQVRQPGEAFAEPHPRFGTVYHVSNRTDMAELIRREHALAWTAHPRIKASNWTPDSFRHEDYFKAASWLGGAWKAMPGDLSRERLGERVLGLLDNMANWGDRKYTPGEVDTFKLFNDHEIYGHMNINYVRLDRLPRYGEGWQPLLDALNRGQFFVTTGEVRVREFTVGGRRSGEAIENSGPLELRADLDWTFPLKFAEVISGDGQRVYRERFDLTDTTQFGQRMLTLRPDLRGRKWVRFEAWDVAANGAFTMPVWLE